MKKFLLSLLALLSFSAFSFGAVSITTDEVISELTFPNYNDKSVGSYTAEWTATKDELTWTFFGFNNNNNAWEYIKCGRKGNESTATIMTPQVVNGKATRLVITLDKTNNVKSITVTPYKNGTALTPLDALDGWGDLDEPFEVELGISERIDADQIQVTISNESAAANGPTQISKLVLYGIPGEASAVATPVITPKTGTYFGDQTVTITCATEGAKIYYLKTVNFEEGSEMQKDYVEYKSPISIKYDNGLFGKTTDATISAYAVIPATDTSAEQTSQTITVTLNWGTVYTTIAAANEAATPTKTDAGIMADNWLVTYVNGQYTYLTDGNYGLLLYGSNLGLEQGQAVSGLITGKLCTYNGLPELASPDVSGLEVVSEGNEVAPIVVSAAALAAEKMRWVNMFVTVEKALPEDDFEAAAGDAIANYNFESEDVPLAVRNQFKIGFEAIAGNQYSVTGFYAIFNDGGQIYPTAIEEYVDPAEVMGDITEYYLQNPSFELDLKGQPLTEEQKFSNGTADILCWSWTGVGESWNNTELLNASSTSGSQFGTAAPSDGDYSLFFRQGWNGDEGNVIELRSGLTTELPAGYYILSVDYKQHYSYDQDSQANEYTYIGLSLNIESWSLAETISEPAPGVKGSGPTTYFADEEWKTLEVMLNLEDAENLDAVITFYCRGARRSDFFIDNVRLYRITEEDYIRKDLDDLIARAQELVDLPFGKLFTASEEGRVYLQNAIDRASQVSANQDATAEQLDNAGESLFASIQNYYDSFIYPDEDKQYVIQQKESGMYMTLDGGTKLTAEPTPLQFWMVLEPDRAPADKPVWTHKKFAITDGEEFVALSPGENAWTMGVSEKAYFWSISVLGDGYYTIDKLDNANHHVGSDNTTEGSSCYANKGINDRSKWVIKEFFENPATVFTAGTARGAWKYDAEEDRMHYDQYGVPVIDTPDDYKFSFIEKDGKKFLYSLGAKKFVQPQKYLLEGITTPVRLEPTGAEHYYIIRAENSNLTINIGSSQWTWDTWTTADDGNEVNIHEVGEFDATEALAMLENTPLDQHKVYTVVTKRGQWAASADHKSLSTTGANTEATDADKQFAFYYDGADIYIYSVGAKKFFKNDGTFFGSKGDAVDYRIVAPLNNNDYDHCFFFTSNLCYFNMQGNGTTYAINTWSSPDDGNKQKLTAVEGVDVYEEMETVFNTPVLDVTYEVYFNDKKVAEETVQQLDGDDVKIPEDLDRGLCTLTTDIDKVNVDHKTVKVTAIWNDLFQFSESFDDAIWYNMDIRSGWQVYKCENEPYTMKNDPTVDELASDEYQWAFAGDPYNLIVYNKSLSGSWTLTKDGDMAVMREGDFIWEPFAREDGFVMRAQGTTDQWINQSGGGRVDCPLKFWAGGRTDDGSTFRISEAPVILEGLKALKDYDLNGKESADVILRLAEAKVTYVTTIENDLDGETVTYDAVVMEDATAGELIARVGLGDVFKVGDTVSGDIHLTKEAGYSAYLPNDKTAADLENLEITEGEADPIAVNEDNVDAYAYNPSWYWAEFQNAKFIISEDGAPTVQLPVLREVPFAVYDILGALDDVEMPEDGTEGTVRGYLVVIDAGRETIEFFQPISFENEETLDLAIDVERPVELGYEATTATVDFAEALEFLGVEELTTDMLYFVSPDGTRTSWADYNKAIDGWCNAEGEMQNWGANAFVCAKFFQAIPDGEFNICDMGGDQGAAVPAVGDEFSCQWALKSGNKVVVYTINVTFVEPPIKYLADYTEKGSFDVTIYAPEKGVAFDGEESEAFDEADVSELIGVEWGDVYGKGITDEVGETFATEYSCDPEPGFWCLEDGTADVYDNGVFGVSLIPAEDWSTFTFQAWTKEAIENNLTTVFYLVNEATKEYVTYNITLSAKPAVNLVGTFDGFLKQILSHPLTGKQGEATGEQTITIAEGEEEGTYDVTYSGFVMPITGAILPEFTITGVEAEISEDGTSAKYVLPAWAPQSITIDRGTGTVTYDIAFEGTKEGNEIPVLKLTLDNSVIDEVYFGKDEKTIDKSIFVGINDINIAGSNNKIFDLSGRKLDKVQKSGIYIVNGKKVSVK